jgi:Family of unknown function (DUF6345)
MKALLTGKVAIALVALFMTMFPPLAPAADRQIGGYVDQAESRFTRNVWNFIKNFQQAQHVGAHSWTVGQYFWAEPFEFVSNKASFVDSMDLAYFSGHGSAYVFATHDAVADVDLRNAAGYGNLAKGGDLEFLIVEDCLTVASAPEAADWWSPWLRDSAGNHIFQGMHQVVGFRTLSVSDNGIPDNYAHRLIGGQGVWQAWFAAVNDERSWWHSDVSDGVPYPGFASVVLYPGLDNDSIGNYGADPLFNHTALRTYWQY